MDYQICMRSIAVIAQNTHKMLYQIISYSIQNAPKTLYGFGGMTGDDLCRAIARLSPTPGWYEPITCDERIHQFMNGRTILLEMIVTLAIVSITVVKIDRFLSK